MSAIRLCSSRAEYLSREKIARCEKRGTHEQRPDAENNERQSEAQEWN